MQDKVFSYSDPFECAFISAESTLDIEFARCNMAYEYAENLYNIKIKEADLKVMNESGTYDDIDALYEEAEQQTGEKKKGVIASIFTAIANFISNIFSSLAKLFGGKDDEQLANAAKSGQLGDCYMDGDPNKASLFISTWNQVKSFCSPAFTKEGKNGERVFSLSRTLLTSLAAAGFGFAVKKKGADVANGAKKKFKGSFIYPIYIKVRNAFNDIRKTSNELKDKTSDDAANTDSVKDLGTVVMDMAKIGGNLLEDLGGALKKSMGKAVDKLTGKSGKDAQKQIEGKEQPKLAPPKDEKQTVNYKGAFDGDDGGVTGESALDDLSLDDIYNEMDYMESVDYEDSCNELIELFESM